MSFRNGLQEPLQLVGHGVELVPDEVEARDQPHDFTHTRVLPVRRGHRRTGLFPYLLDFEAPHPPPASMVLDGPDEVPFRTSCDLGGGQARPEYSETSGRCDGLPCTNDLGEHTVELMGQQRLEAGTFGAQAMILTPGATQLHVPGREELPTRPVPVTLSDLTSDPHNANRGTARGREALADSLRAYAGGLAPATPASLQPTDVRRGSAGPRPALLRAGRPEPVARSLAEGLEETLTLHRLGVYAVLGRAFVKRR